mmetsp:Transcript_4919/g.14348  ORF Transcript_4919/g.14348 Transcript_4919/m.14348 type:complete len:213 (+) Transcript_4919:277-915(+)
MAAPRRTPRMRGYHGLRQGRSRIGESALETRLPRFMAAPRTRLLALCLRAPRIWRRRRSWTLAMASAGRARRLWKARRRAPGMSAAPCVSAMRHGSWRIGAWTLKARPATTRRPAARCRRRRRTSTSGPSRPLSAAWRARTWSQKMLTPWSRWTRARARRTRWVWTTTSRDPPTTRRIRATARQRGGSTEVSRATGSSRRGGRQSSRVTCPQ